MGGMAAQIPIKNDDAANEAALDKVRAGQAARGEGRPRRHLGRAPGAGARSLATIFDEHMPGKNQIEQKRDDVTVTAPSCSWSRRRARAPTPALRHNIRVGVQYIEAWLRGNGCVPLYYLMEDAATAEISRTQIWQWVQARRDPRRRPAGRPRIVSPARSTRSSRSSANEIGDERFERGAFGAAKELFFRVATSDELDRVPDAARLRATPRDER